MTNLELKNLINDYNKALDDQCIELYNMLNEKCKSGLETWVKFHEIYDKPAYKTSKVICDFWRERGFDVKINMQDYHLSLNV